MGKVNYSSKRLDDGSIELVCDSCGGGVLGSRDQFLAWVTGAADPSMTPFALSCPKCGDDYIDWSPAPERSTLENEFVRFGITVFDVMQHRHTESDFAIDANIGFILLDKEERKGLASFSASERFVYAIQGMDREVNNGGFGQFFDNSSGELAFDLIPALEAVRSTVALAIARRALALFGKPSSLSDRARSRHLRRITKDYSIDPWEHLDNEYYDCTEDLVQLALDFIERNIDQFVP